MPQSYSRAVSQLSAPDYPINWTWADGAIGPGPAVLVDVDGVIADGWHRQHYLRKATPDWRGFFAAAGDDAPIAGAAELLSAISAELVVVLLTARPHNLHQITLDWLKNNAFRWDLLIMRARSDGGLTSPDFKKRSVDELRDRDFSPVWAIDDDQRNVDMFRDHGVPAMYMHSGYYEA